MKELDIGVNVKQLYKVQSSLCLQLSEHVDI